jgi:membrane associated rhomboid family serine protease
MDTPVECARHPGRAALTICARCERPVCADDLIEAPVGYQCVDCARSGPTVRRLTDRPALPLTQALVLTIVGVALLGTTGVVDARSFGLVPVLVGLGEWWRLITSAFLHGGLLHLAFNGILLWRLGESLEPTVGTPTFAGLAASGMAGGGLGVVGLAWLGAATSQDRIPLLGWVLASGPLTITVGASGMVFGLMGALLAMLRRRGIDPWSTSVGSTVGALVLLNLVLTFAVPSISVGGHVGGLLGGLAAGALVSTGNRARRRDATVTLGLAAALLALAMLAAGDLVRRLAG